MPDVPDGFGGIAGLYNIAEWAAREGKEVYIEALKSPAAFDQGKNTYYAVPAGKILYIVSMSFIQVVNNAADYDHHLWAAAWLYDNSDTTHVYRLSGAGGANLTLPKPLVIPGGHTAVLSVVNQSNVNCKVQAVALGYEI